MWRLMGRNEGGTRGSAQRKDLPLPTILLKLLPVCVDGLWCPSVTWTVSVCLCAWLLSDVSGSYHCLWCGDACGLLGVHQPVGTWVQSWLAAAGADSWLKVCVEDFCLSGDYNGNLSCIDWATQNDRNSLSDAIHQVQVTLECCVLPAGDEAGRAGSPVMPFSALFTIPWCGTSHVELHCCRLLSAGLQPPIPCSSLCAHLGLACLLSLAQQNLVLQ